ncbi:hypothetical protein [Phenylobacterium aquaticum]|uniref:hypothetical protein n=1 Tax=Phenylobacterium aquaticum TaxID=1763816 RepID=UPI001F5C75B8|nr:hypothetical protein [Phenylobacterium aquaticum]MCI3131287.1 hypothetical protein [Phenylobacterium aquaticum]
MKPALPLFALVAFAAAPPAGEMRCWLDQGVLVVSASVAGAAGDYILDTAAPHTVLHETRAQSEGYAGTSLTGDVWLAGRVLRDRPVAVSDLDARTWAFPTPIAGVIGADILSAYVVDIRFAPCRVRLSAPSQAPRFRGGQTMAFALPGDAPAVTAAVSDGPRARSGPFVIATGADTGLRLSEAYASAPGAAKPAELLPYGAWRARLRAASLAGQLWENLTVGLLADADLPPGAIGAIGPPRLAAWRLRIDYPGRQVVLAPLNAAPPRP